MKINQLNKTDFIKLVFEETDIFIDKIENKELFVVKNFYPAEDILKFRDEAHKAGELSEPSWHPCFDGCPDFHRIHDNYPNAHVKAIMHAYYRHGYHVENYSLFDYFFEIFDIKNYLAGKPKGSYIKNIPSQKYIARVNIHNYPRGGGYQQQHIDPVSTFAKIQTIVQASKIGEDFNSGGVYAKDKKTGEKLYIDPHTEVGDLIVLSPNIVHGVEEIDPEANLTWKENSGRWMIMPIIIHSDYPSSDNIKPMQV